jgi:hypothetical protein
VRLIEVAEEGLAILLSRVGQVLNELFDLLAAGVLQRIGAAEVDGIGFNQFGVELVLADQLAEPVANPMPGNVAVCPGNARRELGAGGGRSGRTRPAPNLLD